MTILLELSDLSPTSGQDIASYATLRPGKPEDAAACGRICFDAFAAIANAHGFPPDFPSPAVAAELAASMLNHPVIYSVVAEMDGHVVGVNYLDCRNSIAAPGPITVDPKLQNGSVGRRLMEDVHRHARERGVAGVRLVQAAYHSRSLSLYTKLGYQVREPLACIQGPPLGLTFPGRSVRAASESDLDACNRLCHAIHGHDRGGELRDAIGQGTASVVECDGRITGYSTLIGFFGHAVAESNTDLQALIGAAKSIAGPGLLVPMRNTGLFAWCLAHGLRVVQPMTLMTLGQYQEPEGVFLPSILY